MKIGALDVLRRRGLLVHLGPGGFRDDHIVFAASDASTRSIYEIPISLRNWKAADDLRRLTFGTGLDAQPFPGPGGRIAFVSLSFTNNVWLLPIDARGQTGTEIRRVTEGYGYDATPSCSRDGTKLVFTSSRLGNREVWIRDLNTGSEAAVTATPVDELSPAISADGSKVAYTVAGQAAQPIYVADTRTAPGSTVPEKVCDDCGQPVDWSPDGSRIVYIFGTPRSVGSLDVATGRKSVMVQPAKFDVDQAQISPDGAWVTVVAATEANHTRIFVVPLRDGVAATEDRWIAVTRGDYWDARPRWSPRGELIYF